MINFSLEYQRVGQKIDISIKWMKQVFWQMSNIAHRFASYPHNPLGLRIISLVLSAFIFSPSKFTPYITSTHNPKAQNLCHSSSTSYELRIFLKRLFRLQPPIKWCGVAWLVAVCSVVLTVCWWRLARWCCRRMEVRQHQPASSRWVEARDGNYNLSEV